MRAVGIRHMMEKKLRKKKLELCMMMKHGGPVLREYILLGCWPFEYWLSVCSWCSSLSLLLLMEATYFTSILSKFSREMGKFCVKFPTFYKLKEEIQSFGCVVWNRWTFTSITIYFGVCPIIFKEPFSQHIFLSIFISPFSLVICLWISDVLFLAWITAIH